MPPYHDDHEASIIPQIYYGDIICLVGNVVGTSISVNSSYVTVN